jgi:hypothetical protein
MRYMNNPNSHTLIPFISQGSLYHHGTFFAEITAKLLQPHAFYEEDIKSLISVTNKAVAQLMAQHTLEM